MLTAFLVAIVAAAQVSPPATAELVASVAVVRPGEPFLAAVVIRTQPSWHVYWQNPGDTGTPTTIDWNLPAGWTAGELMWPIPHRFSDGDMVSYGYEGTALLLARITPPKKLAGKTVSFAADVSWLACKEACIQGGKGIRLTLPVGTQSAPSKTWSERLVAAEQAIPKKANMRVVATAQAKEFLLKGGPTPTDFGDREPVFFPSESGIIEHASPQIFRQNGDGSFSLALKQSSFLSGKPQRLRGILVAPKGTKWNGGLEAIAIDVPLSEENK